MFTLSLRLCWLRLCWLLPLTLMLEAPALAATSTTAPSISRPPQQLDSLAQLPRLALRTLDGRNVTLREWLGRETIIGMDHTGSFLVCSDTSRRLKAVQTAMERLRRPHWVLVLSLDPANDSVDGWHRYVKSLGYTHPPANWVFLRPRESDLAAWTAALGVQVEREGDVLLHEVRLLRFGPDGKIVRTLDGYDRDTERFLNP